MKRKVIDQQYYYLAQQPISIEILSPRRRVVYNRREEFLLTIFECGHMEHAKPSEQIGGDCYCIQCDTYMMEDQGIVPEDWTGWTRSDVAPK